MPKFNKYIVLSDPLDNQNAGIHIYTLEMINSLCKLDHQSFSLIRESPTKKETKCTSELKLRSYKFPGYKTIRYFFQIPYLIRKVKPEVVIEPAHFGPFNLPKKIKRVTIIHDLTPIIYPQWHRWHSQILQRIFLKQILRNVDFVLANSQNTLKDLHHYYPFTKQKSEFIYPGIDPFYICQSSEINYSKKNFFLYTGTVEPRKNLITLIRAFEMFKSQTLSEIKLFIVGGKGWKSELFYNELKQNKYKNDIKLKGYIAKTELRDLYKNCLSFIYPSYYEGFGFPVAEAMACGAPCITSKTSSLVEVGGNAALFIDPQNEQDLCDKMLLIESNSELRLKMINKGLKQSKKFRWDIFAQEFYTILKNLSES